MPRARNVPLKVGDVMIRDVLVGRKEDTVRKLASEMNERRVGSVVITDDEGKPIGIVTERDLVYVCARGLPADTQAWAVMSENPLTVREDELITDAMEKMRSADVRHLPVVDSHGKLIGLISFRDVIDAASILLSIS